MVLPIALIFLMALVAWIRGAGNIIDWTTFQFQITRETISHTFDVGTFEFAVPIESYLTFEYFNGTHVQPNTFYSYLFLAGIIISAIVLLSVITTLDRFWFITGMGLFILFMVSLRIDVLKLFGMNGRLIPISIIALFAPYKRCSPFWVSVFTKTAIFAYWHFASNVNPYTFCSRFLLLFSDRPN